MDRIQSRSPYIVEVTDTNLTSCVVEFFIFTGIYATSRPATANYTLQVEAIDETCIFDISEFADDLLDIEFDGNYDSQMIWFDYRITKYISEVAQSPSAFVLKQCFGGYLYFEEGTQNESASEILTKTMITGNTFYRPEGEFFYLPFFDAGPTTVNYKIDGVTVDTENFTGTLDSSLKIAYVEPTNSGVPSTDVNEVVIAGTSFYLKSLTCSKHDAHKVTFINKWGALQDIWFIGKSSLKIKTDSTSMYRRNTLVGDSYSINEHTSINQVKNGKQTLKVTTGFVSENYNDVIKELSLSRKVWINYNGNTLPVNVKTETIDFKTSLNDKLVEYSMELEFSFDVTNNIR